MTHLLRLELLRAEIAEKNFRPVMLLEMLVEAVHVRERLGLAAQHVAAEGHRWLLEIKRDILLTRRIVEDTCHGQGILWRQVQCRALLISCLS